MAYKKKKVRNYKRKIPEGSGPPKDHRDPIKIPKNAELADMSLTKEIPDGPGTMTLNEFQNLCKQFIAFPNTFSITYPTLGLASEAGEVAGKVKKAIRDRNNLSLADLGPSVKPELGDCAWYIAVLAYNLGYTLEEVALDVINKLTSRKERGVISGSGDNR